MRSRSSGNLNQKRFCAGLAFTRLSKPANAVKLLRLNADTVSRGESEAETPWEVCCARIAAVGQVPCADNRQAVPESCFGPAWRQDSAWGLMARNRFDMVDEKLQMPNVICFQNCGPGFFGKSRESSGIWDRADVLSGNVITVAS